MDKYVYLPISKGMTTKIDKSTYDVLKKNRLLKWNAQKCYKKFYVSRSIKEKKIYLHRFIMNAQPGLVIDHIDGDPLNNTKKNLRLCYHRDNQRNKGGTRATGFKGTSFATKGKTWIAQISMGNKHVTLGRFEREEDAAKVYDLAAILLFGKFAYPNFQSSWKFLKMRNQLILELLEKKY